jgi:sporulation protein YlmC with PRC-barrel domain
MESGVHSRPAIQGRNVETVNGTFSSPPGSGSGAGAGDDRGADDPVSWLQIEQGWNVVTSDGVVVGTVGQVEGDKNDDIFDGLAVASGKPARILYVPGETVGPIFPGRVTLNIASADVDTLQPFQAPSPETKWTPGKAPLSTRLSSWLRGKR